MDNFKQLDSTIQLLNDKLDHWEIFLIESNSQPIKYEANILKEAQKKESSGIALRIINKGNIGLASARGKINIDTLLNNAIESSLIGQKALFEFPKSQNYKNIITSNNNIKTMDLDNLISIGNNILKKLSPLDKKMLLDIGISKSEIKTKIINSTGLNTTSYKNSLSLSAHGNKTEKDDMLFIWDGQSHMTHTPQIQNLIKNFSWKFKHSENIATLTPGEMPVIFTPEAVSSIFLEPLSLGLNGKYINEKSSPLTTFLGEKRLDSKFTLIDNPCISKITGNEIMDDEGIATKPINLIKNGVIESFLFDLQSAGQAKTITTGNAHRSLTTLPSPSITLPCIEKGSTSLNEMINDIENGLYIDGVLGAGQSNTLGGEINANVLLGFKITKGKLNGRVKNTLISGNIYKMLRNIAAIENKTKLIYGSANIPHIYIKNVSIATKPA